MKFDLVIAADNARLEGCELEPTRAAALCLLNAIPDVRQNENGQYFCTSRRSAHVRDLIRNEKSSHPNHHQPAMSGLNPRNI